MLSTPACSGRASRALASRSGPSAPGSSRLMTGERFPAWKNVAATVRARGADPDVLRQVWAASAARQATACPAPPRSLATALRFLHHAPVQSHPRAIAITTGNSLDRQSAGQRRPRSARGCQADVVPLSADHLVLGTDYVARGEPTCDYLAARPMCR
ncbi:hypothetical protein LV779_25535 [Streptomyces thinghirensis]|nr:hypothetical protein [Streptomyces thinghirensis]